MASSKRPSIVQKLLGHASSATTQRYAHLNQDELRQASSMVVTSSLDETKWNPGMIYTDA